MATGIINNGDYSIEDDSNGNLIVTDANDNTVLTYDDANGQLELGTLDATTVNTEEGRISESFTRDFGTNFPHTPRGPELDGPPGLQRHPSVSNPVVEPADVSGIANVEGIADQFVSWHPEANEWVLQCEILHDGGITIGYGSAPPGSLDFSPIEEFPTMPGGNSWPYHRRIGGTDYLFPTAGTNNYDIWTATSYPDDWESTESVNLGYDTHDHAPVYWDDRWYLIAYENGNDQTRLFYDDSGLNKTEIVGGNWVEHPSSPIYSTGGKERLAGGPINHGKYVLLWLQDVDAGSIYIDVISQLTTSSVTISESATGEAIKPSRKAASPQTSGPWDGSRLHHVTTMQSISGDHPLYLVDGQRNGQRWRVGAFRPGQERIAMAAPQMSSQSIPDNTDTQLTFGSLEYNYGQGWDSSNNEFVAPVEGVYQVVFTVDVQSPTSGTELERWIKVNTTDKEKISDDLGGKFSEGKDYSRPVQLDEGDTVGAYVWHNEGSSLDTLDANTVFSVTRE